MRLETRGGRLEFQDKKLATRYGRFYKCRRMMRSLQQFPAGGWEFYEPTTGWRPNSWMDFNDVVRQIISHRQANPRFNLSTDREQVAAQLVAFTEARLRSTYGAGADQWILNESGSPPPDFITPRRRQPGVAAAVGLVEPKRVSMAIGLLLDFLGPSLRPVSHELAEKRAAVCVTCPNNQPGGMLDHVAGEALKKLLEYKAEEKLFTSHDDQLRECLGCRCNLRLKPHVELAYILEKTSPEVMEKLTTFCWIKTHDSQIPLTS